MTPTTLVKKSNRWFVRTVATVITVCFLSLQILPPGWAQAVSLEEQIQKQIPEKAPSEIINSTSSLI
ncbi:MAG: hypothetical protein HY351_02365 [Candidatus Omnitrophica bacterium]|nr:hypothetical protein [Candidatus Omnitrophota bacterium]